MGAHRTSLREDAVVVGGVLEMDIIDGSGEIRTVVKDEDNDEWLAASTSLGLLGIIGRMKLAIYPETKVWARQEMCVSTHERRDYADNCSLEEEDVLNGNLTDLIAPYETANLWVRDLIFSARRGSNNDSGGPRRRSSTGGTTTRCRKTNLTRKASNPRSPSRLSRPPRPKPSSSPEKSSRLRTG